MAAIHFQDDMSELIDTQLSKNLEAEAKKDAKKPVKKTAKVGAQASPIKKKLFAWKSWVTITAPHIQGLNLI